MMIRKKIRGSDAPSIRAASMISVGSVRMNWRMRNIAQAPPVMPAR